MNVLEVERTLYGGVAATVVYCFFGLIIGVLAKFKGYSFLAWFGTGGAILLAAIVLAFQPKVRFVALTEEEILRITERGNKVGWILSLVVYIGILLSVVVWLSSVSTTAGDSDEFMQRYLVPAMQWTEWPWVVANCLMLVRFFYFPRGEKSLLMIVAFTLLAIQVGWPFVSYWIGRFGLFEDPNSSTLRILHFTMRQVMSMGILFLYFVVTERKKPQAV